MTISVVVTTYNDGEYLKGCLSSIAAQQIPPDEVIIVDDGTCDPAAMLGIEEALAAYPETICIRQANAGPSAARNRGLTRCRGDFVAFVDADDRLTPDNLKFKRDLFERSENVVATYGGFLGFDEYGVSIRRSHFREYFGQLQPDLVGRRYGLPGGLHQYLFRTSALQNIGLFDESLMVMEDFDAILRLGRQGGLFAGCNAPIYVRNIRQGSLSRSSATRNFRRTMMFLSKARREGYFSRTELARRHLVAVLTLARGAAASGCLSLSGSRHGRCSTRA